MGATMSAMPAPDTHFCTDPLCTDPDCFGRVSPRVAALLEDFERRKKPWREPAACRSLTNSVSEVLQGPGQDIAQRKKQAIDRALKAAYDAGVSAALDAQHRAAAEDAGKA